MTQPVLIDPLQDSEVLQASGSSGGARQSGSGASYQLVDLDVAKNKSNILKRTNFRPEERDVLVGLITEYMGVLDRRHSKGTGRWRYSHLTPSDAWKLITDKFNNHPGFRQRDPSQLRKCWMNMKARSQFSMAQRRQLGLEYTSTRPSSRSGNKTRPSVAIRLRNANTPSALSSRSYVNRKSNLSRVNGSNTVQMKVKRSRQRIQEERYQPEVIEVDQRGYKISKSAQGFSNYQVQSRGSSSEMQYLPGTVQDRQSQPHPVHLQVHQATGVMPQASEMQRLPEMRTSPGYLMADATSRSGDRRHGNIHSEMPSSSHVQAQHHRQQIAIQPPTILAQMEQFSPPMMSNPVTVGEFLGKTVEMRPTGSTRSVYNPRDDGSRIDAPMHHLHTDDNPSVASVAATDRLLPQDPTGDDSSITVCQVRSIESMADLESVLETGGQIISNISSIPDDERPQSKGSAANKDLDEIQFVIKTEVDSDESPEVQEVHSPVDKVTRIPSKSSWTQTPQKDGRAATITKPKNTTYKPPKETKEAGTQTKIEPKGTIISSGHRCSTSSQGDSAGDDLSGKKNRDKSNYKSATHDHNGKRNESLFYEDDDIVMDVGEGQDTSFEASGNESNTLQRKNQQSSVGNNINDDSKNPSLSSDVSEPPNDYVEVGNELGEVEKKARVDLLHYQVEKAKEEAGAAKCRRELLEVELETARQQVELTKRKQEVEIQLMQEQVRQEKAKADGMVAQLKESHINAGPIQDTTTSNQKDKE